MTGFPDCFGYLWTPESELENRHGREVVAGSNPAPSAKRLRLEPFIPWGKGFLLRIPALIGH